jgi:hypothetical protein
MDAGIVVLTPRGRQSSPTFPEEDMRTNYLHPLKLTVLSRAIVLPLQLIKL